MLYENPCHPRWANASGTQIELQVMLRQAASEPVEDVDWLHYAEEDTPNHHTVLSGPYTYVLQEGDADFARAVAGAFGPVAPFVPPVPVEVGMLQFRRALRALELMDGFRAWLASGSDEMIEAWELGRRVRRDGALVAAWAADTELQASALDGVFVKADALSGDA